VLGLMFTVRHSELDVGSRGLSGTTLSSQYTALHPLPSFVQSFGNWEVDAVPWLIVAGLCFVWYLYRSILAYCNHEKVPKTRWTIGT